MTVLLFFIASVVLVTLILLFRKLRRPSPKRSSPSAERQRAAEPFKGIAIVLGPAACDAVQNLEGKRFLLRNAPRLPLQNCTENNCGCTFKKLDDRRDEIRRWSDCGVESILFNGDEQRTDRKDRRAS